MSLLKKIKFHLYGYIYSIKYERLCQIKLDIIWLSSLVLFVKSL